MNFDKAANFIWTNGRLLERRIFEYVFYDGSKKAVIDALNAYQNDDGGFGNALEPDLRTPESQPVCVEFGLRTLYDLNIQDRYLAFKVCEFISNHADLEKGIPDIFPSAGKYPKAAHWNNPQVTEPSFSRLTGLVGLLSWQQIKHPWLDKAVAVCLRDIRLNNYDDSHTILNAFCLLESMPQTSEIEELYNKLADEVYKCRFLNITPSKSYGLSPLDFSPNPQSYCRKIFSDDVIKSHLEDIESQQAEDGGWELQWEPPGEMSRLEWRAYKTLKNLMILDAYKDFR